MYVRFMCCVIKCIKTKRMLKGKFASSVFHSCNAKTQKTEICFTGPQCVNITEGCLNTHRNYMYCTFNII
jgi:hypothetical protein